MKKYSFDIYGLVVRILCIASLYLCICSFFLPFVLVDGGLYALMVLLGGFWFYLVGYFVQYICSLLFGFKRAAASKAYESDVKHFKLHQAIIPSAIVIGIVILYSSKISGIIANVDIDDAVKNALMMIAPLGIVAGIGGAVIWFYPTERVVSEKTTIIGACIIFISYVFFGTLGIYVRSLIWILILYVFCAALTLSYTNMTRNYMGTVVSFINKKSRRYSLTSSLVFISICLACFMVTATITVGIVIMFKSLLFFILNSGTESGRNEIDEVPIMDRYNFFVYGEERPTSALAFYFFILFVIAMLCGLVYFIFHKNRKFRAFLRKIKKLFADFFAMLKNLFGGNIDFGYKVENVNYIDTEKKIQPKIITSKKKYRLPKTYRSFCDKLNQIEADSDKILYSYVTLIELSRKGHNKLKKSDTPREMATKLRRDPKYRDIEKITEAFEIIEYARADISKNDARFVIDTMQDIIRVSIEH